jgi:hypothetical protein
MSVEQLTTYSLTYSLTIFLNSLSFLKRAKRIWRIRRVDGCEVHTKKKKRPMQDSNLRSPAPETDALPLGQLAALCEKLQIKRTI